MDQSGQMVVLELQWDDPVGGQGMDEFILVDPDTLHIRSTLVATGQKVQYVVVYNRKK